MIVYISTIVNPRTINDISTEILENILSYLNVADIKRISLISRSFTISSAYFLITRVFSTARLEIAEILK